MLLTQNPQLSLRVVTVLKCCEASRLAIMRGLIRTAIKIVSRDIKVMFSKFVLNFRPTMSDFSGIN